MELSSLNTCRRPTLQAHAHKSSRTVLAAAKKGQAQRRAKGFGKQSPTAEQPAPVSTVEAAEAALQDQPGPIQPDEQVNVQPEPAAAASAAAAAAPAAAAELPSVSRERVLVACAQVSGVLAAVGLLMRAAAPLVSPAVRDGHEDAVSALLQWPSGITATEVGWALAAAGAVTAARSLLLQAWPEFRAASDRSNQQVLTPLQPLDLVVVAALPGISEELLFRGGLIPAIYPDWRGVLIAGAAFGLLHNNGGRNLAFSAWATAVGCVYGGLFLLTHNVYAPMLAHSVANLASAALWVGAEQRKQGAAP